MPKVKIYSTPTCPYCKIAKEFFKEKNISFEDIDITSNPEAAEEMKKISGQIGVPVIVINGKVITGFDREKIEEALK
jgi:glutaredoxin-like YruB-family protein